MLPELKVISLLNYNSSCGHYTYIYIKIHLREMGLEGDSSGIGEGTVAGFLNTNKHSRSIQAGNSLTNWAYC